MEKYTNLEQAMRDPSLAIITEDITTQIELNRIFVKYKVLPKRQKRFSNYYSNEFLGHNVPEMYVLVKDKFIIKHKHICIQARCSVLTRIAICLLTTLCFLCYKIIMIWNLRKPQLVFFLAFW